MSEHAIRLVRTIRASATDLYKAWTDPSIMKRWLADVVEADAQVGGTYRLELHARDGSLRELSGAYEVLEPAARIVMTYSDIDVQPELHQAEQVAVTFKKLAATVTELELVHGWNGQPMTDTERRSLEASWGSRLDRLVDGVELPSTLDG